MNEDLFYLENGHNTKNLSVITDDKLEFEENID